MPGLAVFSPHFNEAICRGGALLHSSDPLGQKGAVAPYTEGTTVNIFC